MILGFLLFATVIARSFPDTPFSRTLVKHLVEVPIDAVKKLERRHIILLVFVLFAGQSLAVFGSAELALAYAIDMSVYYDLLIVAWTTSALKGLKTNLFSLKLLLLRRPQRRRIANGASTASPAPALKVEPANDEEDIRQAQAA